MLMSQGLGQPSVQVLPVLKPLGIANPRALPGGTVEPEAFTVKAINGFQISSLRGRFNVVYQVVEDQRIGVRGLVPGQNHVGLVQLQGFDIDNTQLFVGNAHGSECQVLGNGEVFAVSAVGG